MLFDGVDLGLPAGAEVGPLVVGEGVRGDRESDFETVQEAFHENRVGGAAAAVEDQVDGRSLAGLPVLDDVGIGQDVAIIR